MAWQEETGGLSERAEASSAGNGFMIFWRKKKHRKKRRWFSKQQKMDVRASLHAEQLIAGGWEQHMNVLNKDLVDSAIELADILLSRANGLNGSLFGRWGRAWVQPQRTWAGRKFFAKFKRLGNEPGERSFQRKVTLPHWKVLLRQKQTWTSGGLCQRVSDELKCRRNFFYWQHTFRRTQFTLRFHVLRQSEISSTKKYHKFAIGRPESTRMNQVSSTD